MQRLAFSWLVVVAVAALLASSAAAGKPSREFLPAEDFVLPASVCGFEVGVEVVQNKEHVTVFDDGRELITGVFKNRVTNLSNPEQSLLLNISGPGVFTPTEEGFTLEATGRWLWFFFPGELGAGHPGLLAVSSGLVVLEGTETGLSLQQVGGTWTDLCAALA